MDSDVNRMWKAGTASEIVTPDEPLWLAGYAVRTEPAKGKISDLVASALALEDDTGGRLVIASIDLIAITKIIADRVYAEVERQIGLPRERLVLAATHTHYAPEFRPDKALFFKIPPPYAAKIEPTAKRMAEALVRVIVAAAKNLVPVRLFGSRATATFAHNRRREGVKGGTPSKEDTLDHDVNVLDIVHEETGLRKAIVFGYACHNTTIDPQDLRYCADWAGFAKTELQRINDREAALFVAGCGADQNPEPRGTVELSKRYGAELAGAVQKSIISNDRIEITGSVRAAIEDVPLTMQPVLREELEAWSAANDDPPKKVKANYLLEQLDRGEKLITEYAAPVQAIRLGEQLLWIILSGEPVVDWAIQCKRGFSPLASIVWVSGYCNDMYGYVPTRRIQREGGYEGGRANLWSWLPSPWTDDVEQRVTDAIGRVVKKVVEPS
jgi:hypothetical protein